MVGTWKVLGKGSPGSGTEFGADDTDKINKWLRGDLDVDTGALNSPYHVRDNKFQFRNPANTAGYIVRTSTLTTNRETTLPQLLGNDIFVFNDHAATLTQKILAAARISNYVDIESTSTPANPGVNVLRVYRRSSDNVLVYRTNAGVETVLGGAAGGGEINTASNIGATGTGLFKGKVSLDLQFKKLDVSSGGLITITDDVANNTVDFKVTPSGTEGQYLRTVGGSVIWDKPGMTMPDGSFYSGQRWGTFQGGAVDGDGWFGGLHKQGTLTGSTGTTVARTIWETAATIGVIAGWGMLLRAARLSMTPRFKWRGWINPSSQRGYLGFLNQDADEWTGGANPMTTGTGLIAGYDAGDTNFMIRWNNGGTAQSASTGIAKDSNLHTIELLLDSATSSVSAWFDGNLIVNANTTSIPASSTGLSCFANAQAVTATATSIVTEWAMLTFPP